MSIYILIEKYYENEDVVVYQYGPITEKDGGIVLKKVIGKLKMAKKTHKFSRVWDPESGNPDRFYEEVIQMLRNHLVNDEYPEVTEYTTGESMMKYLKPGSLKKVKIY